jgi:hypothetical protein
MTTSLRSHAPSPPSTSPAPAGPRACVAAGRREHEVEVMQEVVVERRQARVAHGTVLELKNEGVGRQVVERVQEEWTERRRDGSWPCRTAGASVLRRCNSRARICRRG